MEDHETPRGYFAIGVEHISKPMNAGSLFRSAHAFGASFVFAIAPDFSMREVGLADTSGTARNLPYYEYETAGVMVLPEDCVLIGVELTDDAANLPSFRHPRRAAYVFGPERGSLSPALLARCKFVVKIPTKFSVNVGVAGAIVMYDRMISLGRYAERPVRTGATRALVKPAGPARRTGHGAPVRRRTAGNAT